MDFITNLLEMDLEALVPALDSVLGLVRVVLTVLLLAGPIVMIALGALYIWFAPPEANYRFGFRTYFGMGSIEAWKYSQKIAGIAFGGLGVVLLIIMVVVVCGFGGMDAFQMASTALTCLLWQAGTAMLARLVVGILAAVYFNPDGTRRRE